MLKIVIQVLCIGFGLAAEWNYKLNDAHVESLQTRHSGEVPLYIHAVEEASNQGQNHWGGICESGTRQSPINIPYVGTNMTYDANLADFDFTDYATLALSGLQIKNNGHAAQLDLPTGSTISGGGLGANYVPLQLHFHWGPDDNSGSEHTFRGRQYPLEMHIVHYKAEYGDVATALENDDGLAVLGVFFWVDDHDSHSGQTDKMAPLVDALASILYKDQTSAISTTTTTLNDLLPADRTEYYRYMGSLTTPTCNEAVVWTVFESKSYITAAQMAEFRKLQETVVTSDTIVPLITNFRKTQAVQPVKKSYVPEIPPSFKWGYHGKEGPAQWPQYYGQCGGNRQSPVSIPANEEIVYDEDLSPLEFINYNETITGTIRNNGHTVQIDITNDDIAISGGKLSGRYRAAQFHFHWGSDRYHGSEHLRNGKAYPLELHIVHYKESYGDIVSALDHTDGLAVIGFFFYVIEVNNNNYNELIDKLPEVTLKGTSSAITDISLEKLTSRFDSSPYYFRYQGSLTTPPCTQIVTWSVMMDTVTIGKDQLSEFYKLMHVDHTPSTIEDDDYIRDNFRPTHDLGTRLVSSSYKFEVSGATRVQQGVASICVIVLCFMMSLL